MTNGLQAGLQNISDHMVRGGHFLRYLGQRFNRDGCRRARRRLPI